MASEPRSLSAYVELLYPGLRHRADTDDVELFVDFNRDVIYFQCGTGEKTLAMTRAELAERKWDLFRERLDALLTKLCDDSKPV